MIVVCRCRTILFYIKRSLTYKSSLSVNFTFLKSMDANLIENSTEASILLPPVSVRGLTKLNKDSFLKTVQVPCIEFDMKVINTFSLKKLLKNYLLRIQNFKPFQLKTYNNSNASNSSAEDCTERLCFLNPDVISSFQDISDSDRSQLETFNITDGNFRFLPVTLSFANWNANVLLKAVLPEEKHVLTSYSIIGHIVHVNIKEHLLPYKYIIGEILLAKVSGAKTVVNKINIIDNTYRNFKMEVLCGEDNFITRVKENMCLFELDFSAVYWNPRLSTEHERIVEKLNAGDTLYDVFAGIGPFSIPACKRKCMVLANDLNPESFKWLVHNSKLNKVSASLKAFNEDGLFFIKNAVKMDMMDKWSNETFLKSALHITMNLPASAVTFLVAFKGLFTAEELSSLEFVNYPIVHVYCFCKSDMKNEALQMVEENLGHKLSNNLIEISFVRNVSTLKDMMRVSFKLFREVLIDSNNDKTTNIGKNSPILDSHCKRKSPAIDDGQTESCKKYCTEIK